MIQGRECFRFTLKSTQAFFVLGKVFRQNLDRHVAIQARVHGQINLTHGPGAKGSEDLIEGKRLACGQAHGVWLLTLRMDW